MKRFKDIGLYLLRISITLGLLIFLFHKVHIASIVEIIKGVKLYFFAGLALFYLLLVFLAIIRWVMLLNAANIKIPFGKVIISYSVGLFCNMFLPSTVGGDLVRSFEVFEYAQDKSRIFASVILDRISGLASVIVVSFFALVFGYRFVNKPAVLGTFAILLGITVFVLVVCFSRRVFKIFAVLFNRLPSLREKLISFNESTVFFRTKKLVLAENLGISIILRIGIILLFYFTAIALGHKSSIVYFFIFVPLIEAISAAPIAIGGLGVRDAAAIFLFTKVGFSSDVAFSMSLINFSLLALAGFIGGIIYVLTLHTRRV
jgi:hypothetical protein